MPAPLVARYPVRNGVLDPEAVSNSEFAIYIRGVYAGRLRRTRQGWGCDADLTARIPWPRGSRTYFGGPDAAIESIRRRLQDAEREARWQAWRRAEREARS